MAGRNKFGRKLVLMFLFIDLSLQITAAVHIAGHHYSQDSRVQYKIPCPNAYIPLFDQNSECLMIQFINQNSDCSNSIRAIKTISFCGIIKLNIPSNNLPAGYNHPVTNKAPPEIS